jgi:hypothetical protein
VENSTGQRPFYALSFWGARTLKMQITCDSLESTYNRTEIKNRIRREFWAAFAAWEEAPQEQKAEVSLQLNRTVRQLY